MFKAAKIFLFALFTLTLLIVGCFGAQALWHASHHRYDQPNTGNYYGSVHALFSGTDDEAYSFQFRGQTKPHWRWAYPTNFTYHSLHFEWHRFGSQAQSSKGSGTISLPSLTYESSQSTGVLTRAVLAEWLLGGNNSTNSSMRSVDAVFGFIEAAGHGSLPRPRHHGHYFEEPVRGHIYHFSLGFGVGGLVYIWIGLWLLLVVFIGRRLWRKHGGA